MNLWYINGERSTERLAQISLHYFWWGKWRREFFKGYYKLHVKVFMTKTKKKTCSWRSMLGIWETFRFLIISFTYFFVAPSVSVDLCTVHCWHNSSSASYHKPNLSYFSDQFWYNLYKFWLLSIFLLAFMLSPNRFLSWRVLKYLFQNFHSLLSDPSMLEKEGWLACFDAAAYFFPRELIRAATSSAEFPSWFGGGWACWDSLTPLSSVPAFPSAKSLMMVLEVRTSFLQSQ